MKFLCSVSHGYIKLHCSFCWAPGILASECMACLLIGPWALLCHWNLLHWLSWRVDKCLPSAPSWIPAAAWKQSRKETILVSVSKAPDVGRTLSARSRLLQDSICPEGGVNSDICPSLSSNMSWNTNYKLCIKSINLERTGHFTGPSLVILLILATQTCK